jgi:hypothetical protein
MAEAGNKLLGGSYTTKLLIRTINYRRKVGNGMLEDKYILLFLTLT